MRAFKTGSDLKQKIVAGDRAEELQANRKSIGSETARNGNRGNARKIGGPIVAKKQSASGVIGLAEADRFQADLGRGDRSGGIDESVERVLFQSPMKLLNEFFAKIERGEIARGGHFETHFEAGADIVAVFRRI